MARTGQRAMSPGSVSNWCSSLAGCKIQGSVLRNLQTEIREQRVDGKAFDEMLKANAIAELQIEGLVPRVCLSIRRAWQTDFGLVTFVEHASAGPPRVHSQNLQPKHAGPADDAPSCFGNIGYHPADHKPPLQPRGGDRLEPARVGGHMEVVQPPSPPPGSVMAQQHDRQAPPSEQPASWPQQDFQQQPLYQPRPPQHHDWGPPHPPMQTDWPPPMYREIYHVPMPYPERMPQLDWPPSLYRHPPPPLVRPAYGDMCDYREMPLVRGVPGPTYGPPYVDYASPRLDYHEATSVALAEAPPPRPRPAPNPGFDKASFWRGTRSEDFEIPRPTQSYSPEPPFRQPYADEDRGQVFSDSRQRSLGEFDWDGEGPRRSHRSQEEVRAPRPRAAVPRIGRGGKPPADICTWLRSLPESHVPEKSREKLAEFVEETRMDGVAFSEYLPTVEPEVCGPRYLNKLKAAWKNVLAEDEAKAICKANLASASRKKGTRIEC